MKLSIAGAKSSRPREASGRVKVWTPDGPTRHSRAEHGTESTNPIYLLAAITLGIPVLLLTLLVAANPAIHARVFTFILGFAVMSAFAIAAIWEIKRLVDQPSGDHH